MGSASVVSGLRLNTPVEEAVSTDARRVGGFARLGVRTVGDLIRHLPTRYERHWAESPIDDLPMGAVGSTRGMIVATRVVPGSRGRGGRRGPKARFEATVEDHSGRLLATWFNASYLHNRLHPGQTIRVQGKVAAHRGMPQMINPQWELLGNPEDVPRRSERLRPVYRATEDLPSYMIEEAVGEVLPRVEGLLADPLPEAFVRSHAMVGLAAAFRMAHKPQDLDETLAARRRLAFNELLLLQMGIAVKRSYNRTRLAAPALHWSPAIDQHIRQRFPFDLTAAQERVVQEIAADLQRTYPMNRLVQGDVGSGKTVVALYALLLAVADRKQGALMAPTELLAEQHYLSICGMLKDSSVRVALLVGGRGSSLRGPARAALLKQIELGQYDLIVGTQALLTDSVAFKNLAVVVIDEQHRFGVLQRAAFRSPGQGAGPDAAAGGSSGKVDRCDTGSDTGGAARTVGARGGRERASPLETLHCPHYLVMTATPIPRTLSLTVFGDLDVSTIDELPPGRQPIKTRVVGPDKSDEVYRHLATRVGRGEQAYVVVPAIDGPDGGDGQLYDDDSDNQDAGGDASATGGGGGRSTGQPKGGGDVRAAAATQLKSVRAHAKLLGERYLPERRVAVIHGRLKRDTRESIMHRYRAGKIDVLVATTVIEVGVDVPNATVMVVEHAERFGLAQLHQLRGRVGRSDHGRASLCVFIAEPTTEEAAKRLKAIASTTDGFKIAEHDLAIRGMGDFFGTRQHGLPPLRVARIPDDMDLLNMARRDAQAIVEPDPTLSAPQHRLLRRVLIQQHGDALGLIDVG